MSGPMKFGETRGVPNSEKIDKESVARQAIDPRHRIGGDTLPDIMRRNKWALGLAKGSDHYSREKTMLQVDGLLRGAIAERISLLIPLSDIDYVAPTSNANLSSTLGESEIFSPADLDQPTLGVRRKSRNPNDEEYWKSPGPNWGWGEGTKVGLAQGMVANTLSVPDEIFDGSIDYSDLGKMSPREIKEEVRARYLAEVVEGFGGAHGIEYEDMTLPDGFLFYKGRLFGTCEVKAYTPDEFRIYVDKAVEEGSMEVFVEDSENGNGQNGNHYRGGMKLGLNVEGEQLMVDRLVDAQNAREHKAKTGEVPPALKPMGPIIPVVLRVLDDVEDDDIQRLTTLAHDLGYPNFLVQKLPFSSEDVSGLVPEALQSMKDTLLGGSTFSKREKKVLTDLMNGAEGE